MAAIEKERKKAEERRFGEEVDKKVEEHLQKWREEQEKQFIYVSSP